MPCSCVFIINSEHVIAGWVLKLLLQIEINCACHIAPKAGYLPTRVGFFYP